jgi:hypothetical protein
MDALGVLFTNSYPIFAIMIRISSFLVSSIKLLDRRRRAAEGAKDALNLLRTTRRVYLFS